MVTVTHRCSLGHSYTAVRPTSYTGKAEYPAACPKCRPD